MYKTIFVLAIVLMAGGAQATTKADVEREITGAFQRSEISNHERWAFATMVVADIAGNESTIDALNRGCRESNPLYGSNPGRAQLYAVDIVVWGAYLWASSRPNWRMEWFGYTRAIINAGQAVSNWQTEC